LGGLDSEFRAVVMECSYGSVGLQKMCRSLKAEYVRMAIAGCSVMVSFLILEFTWLENDKCCEISVWNHVCVLQVIGGICLFVGSLKVRKMLKSIADIG